MMMDGRIDFVEEVVYWNVSRDNLVYSPSLEYSMLDEELGEYMEGGITDDRVNQAKELADIAVVSIGALAKMCDGDIEQVQDILLAVTACNNLKPTARKNGKIIKGDKYMSPEPMIEEILAGW